MNKIFESLIEELVDEASSIAAGSVSATGGSPVGAKMKHQHDVLWSGDKEGDKNTLVSEEPVTKQTMQQGMPEPLMPNQQELDEKRSKSPMATPIIAYHGTNSTFLPNIVNNGLSPDKNVKRNIWQDEESEEMSRLDSLPGIYLSVKVQGAISYAVDSAAKFGGKPVVIIAQIVPQSTFADEDHFNLMRVLERELSNFGIGSHTMSGRAYNVAFAMYYDQHTYETMERHWENAFKEMYPKIPINHELMMRSFRIVALDLIRDIPQMYSVENFASWMFGNPDVLKILKIDLGGRTTDDLSDEEEHNLRNTLENVAEEIVQSAQMEFSEAAYKKMQEDITKYYSIHFRKQPHLHSTFRLDQTIGFSGRNKIIGIAIREVENGDRVWKMLYGQPHDIARMQGYVNDIPAWDRRQQALRQQQRQQQNQQMVQESVISEILENVLDKMGLPKATDNIRKGALSGEVYMDRHDTDKKRTKAVVDKVAKNLNKKPYSHNPPMMGLQEKNKK